MIIPIPHSNFTHGKKEKGIKGQEKIEVMARQVSTELCWWRDEAVFNKHQIIIITSVKGSLSSQLFSLTQRNNEIWHGIIIIHERL